MLIVKRGSVSHDGVVYKQGQALPDMKKADELRLLDLEVCYEGGSPKIIQTKTEATNVAGDINLNFDAGDAIKGKA